MKPITLNVSADLQETFDRVVSHLRTQNAKAYENARCRYRTESGLSCAIGGLIPEDQYAPDIEGKKVMALIASGRVWVPEDMGLHILLQRLQHVHDDWLPRDWEYILQPVADEFGLVYTKPQERK